jgi:hypothetical protein
MDTMKTCMQGDVESSTYQSLAHTTRTIYNGDGQGVKNFFKVGWRTGRMIYGMFIM